jgi:hypothetical protein
MHKVLEMKQSNEVSLKNYQRWLEKLPLTFYRLVKATLAYRILKNYALDPWSIQIFKLNKKPSYPYM